jgi:hypothetical protein
MVPPFTVDFPGLGESAAENCQPHVVDHQITDLVSCNSLEYSRHLIQAPVKSSLCCSVVEAGNLPLRPDASTNY